MHAQRTLAVLLAMIGLASVPAAEGGAYADLGQPGGRVLVVDPAGAYPTINRAAAEAGPGDTVVVRAGIYRERVAPERGGEPGRPVIYLAAPGETVVVRGSEVWRPAWTAFEERPGVYSGQLDPALFTGVNPFRTAISISSHDEKRAARPSNEARLPRTLGQLFVDGQPYAEVDTLDAVRSSPGTWLVAPDGGALIVNFPAGPGPQTRQVEISVRDRIFSPAHRGLLHIQVKGFVFEHCANQGPFPQAGAFSLRSGSDWLVEGNTIRHAKTVGLDCGSEYWDAKQLPDTAPAEQRPIWARDNVIRGNSITDNGLCGIAGWNHSGTLISGNLIERNCGLNFSTWLKDASWEEWAGIKLHASNATIEGNLIRDNEANGIWIDNGYQNARVTRNLVVNNRFSGIFLELGAGAVLIDTNIVAFTRPAGWLDRPGGDFYNGNGIYAHDASDLIVVHNLLAGNAGSGVLMRTITDRTYGGRPVETSNERILNNIFYDNAAAALCLPVASSRARDNVSERNAFCVRVPGEFVKLNELKECPPGADAIAAFRARCAAAGQREGGLADPAAWARHPVLDLAQWSSVQGQDRGSIDASGQFRMFLRPRVPNLTLQAGAKLLAMRGYDTGLVAYDWFGRPMPVGTALPGPFQGLPEGRSDLNLWPVAVLPQPAHAPRDLAVSRIALFDRYLDPPQDAGAEPQAVAQTVDLLAGSALIQAAGWANPDAGPTDAYEAGAAGGELHMQATGGTQSSPARGLVFTAPADGWYRFDVQAAVARRSAKTAGFVQAEVLLLDADGGRYRPLRRFALNESEGYGGHSAGMSWQGPLAMRAGWRLVVRFAVVSPGPAPGGAAWIGFQRFLAEQLSR